MSMSVIELTINDRAIRGEVAPRTHLGDFLRDSQNLTGTHLGCEHGVCGACTVLIDGEPVRSCITFAVACDHQKVRTIEGFDDDELMKRIRRSFSVHHGLQCGYCTPGMLITARDIVRRFPDADESRIRLELSGNLCRCTGYMGIVNAIKAVLGDLKDNPIADVPTVPTAPVRQAAAQETGAFQTFAAVAAAPSTALERAPQEVSAASSVSAAQPAGERKGWTAIDDSFVVPFPLERVWGFMGDLPSVTGCLPGAELIEHDAEKVKGKIAIKFGPMSANFAGAARLERDDAAHRAVMRGAGQDNISRSKANGDVTYALSDEANGTQTRVAVTLEYMLQGPLAQFSRSGLVKDFVRRMIADFGMRITAQLGGADAPDSAALQTRFNVGSLVWSVLWGRIKRLFGRGE
ncbi:2Fe-2S iron-sulfur cluster-binding protein [Paraburkholderia agricolaris]|uniref:2Fe-2S iron-sulfur cluster-binding protein n=1 Tax=Paraburkholderia agricolaris TaxID=2152888 RepID=A0ABW8ZIK7_9BURK